MDARFFEHVYLLARRSINRTLRQPRVIIPGLIFPLILFGVNSSGLKAAVNIPGFPARSYVDFAFTFPFMQGTLLAAALTGTDLAADIKSGFLNRLLLTPAKNFAILLGHLAGVMLVGLVQVAVFTAFGLLLGVHIQSGVLGVLALVGMVLLMNVGLAAVISLVALRVGSGEAVQSMIPIFLALLFLSSSNMPRNLIERDWYRTLVTLNPTSYVIEGVRSLVITGWDETALLRSMAIILLTVVLGIYGATRALRSRAGAR